MDIIAYALLAAVIFLVLCIPAAAAVGFRAGLYKSGMRTKEDWRKGLALAMLISGEERPELMSAMDGITDLPTVPDLALGKNKPVAPVAEEDETGKPIMVDVSRGTAYGIDMGRD